MLTEEQKRQALLELEQIRANKTNTTQSTTSLSERLEKERLRREAMNRLSEKAKEEEKPKSVLDKLSNIGDKTFGKAADFLYSPVGKTVGSLVVDLGQNLEKVTRPQESQQTLDRALYDRLKKQGKSDEEIKKQYTVDIPDMVENIKPTDIAFTALALYPGGGFVTKYLKKLPGGTKTLEYISKLPEKAKAKAIEQYASIFNATSKESKALVKETVPELVVRGEKVSSISNLVEKAELKATNYGEQITKYFNELPADAKEQTKPILDKLNVLKNKYIIDGKIIRPEAVNAIDKTMEKISQFGNEISTESVRKMRQIFDEHFDVSKGLDDISAYTKKAERAAADAIRAEFAKNRPDLAKLNKEFTFWKSVQDLAIYSSEKAKSKFSKNISSIIGGATGFSLGEGFGGKTSGTIIGAWLGTKAIDIMRSPAWKTFSAVEKNKLADAIIKGDLENINLLVGKLSAGIGNQITD